MPQSINGASPAQATAVIADTTAIAIVAPAEAAVTATAVTVATAAAAALRLPSIWQLAVARGGVEVKSFFRDKMAVAFIFGLPSILLVLLGSIFGGQAAARGVTVGQLFTAGMIAGGIMSTSFQYLAIGVAVERESGMLKRLSGTPMPPAAYFAGKIVQVLVCTVSETVLLVAVGMLFYHLHLPTSPGRWWTFAWVFVLGSAACALLGIAVSSVPRSAASATPVVTLPFLVLQFISGVYVPSNSVPGWMRDIASFFPLKWMAQGMRSAFLPSHAAVLEPAHAWEHGRTALVLAIWIAGGLVLCAKTFRWQSRR
jgi:ABC-2 type transport system permease protein